MTTILTDVDKDDLVRRHSSGETLKQLGAAFHICYPRVVAILAERGITPVSNGVRSRKLGESGIAELVGRYVAGESCRELGRAFGVGHAAVEGYLHRAGVELRPRWHRLQAGLDAMDPGELHAKRSTVMRKRWAKATPAERAGMVTAANAAVRGVAQSPEHLANRAITRERMVITDSPYEAMVADWLSERGVSFIPQKAVGPYNLDFAVGNIDIEVTTGWARKKKEWRERCAYLLDRGWHIYVIWHDNANSPRTCDLLPAVADDFIAWAKILESSPALRCQHRVIWRSRKIFSTGSGDADYIAGIFKATAPLGRWPVYESAGHDA